MVKPITVTGTVPDGGWRGQARASDPHQRVLYATYVQRKANTPPAKPKRNLTKMHAQQVLAS